MPNVYIDASGKAGSLKELNENPLVAYAAVVMASQASDQELKRIHARLVLELPSGRKEFKSSKPHRANTAFLNEIMVSVQFSAAVVLGHRDAFAGLGLAYVEPCNKWFTQQALKQVPSALRSGQIIIDQGGTPTEDASLVKYLNKKFPDAHQVAVANAVCSASHLEPGIQLADLIAGLVRRYYIQPDRANKQLYALLAPNLLAVWDFPPPAFKGGAITESSRDWG